MIHAEPYRELKAQMTLELYGFPGPRTYTNVPSMGFTYNLTFENGALEKMQWRLRMKHTIRQKTPSVDLPGISPLAPVQSSSFEGRLVYKPYDRLSWLSRLVLSSTPGLSSSLGYAAVQQVGILLHKKLRCTSQWVVFHIPDWDNRIYLHEPGLFQQFKFPVYYGSGQKVSMVLSLKPFKRVCLEAQGSFMHRIEDVRWATGLQLRLNF